jgi:hypothetical protein
MAEHDPASWAQSLTDERIAEVIESLAYENRSPKRTALYVEAARRLRDRDADLHLTARRVRIAYPFMRQMAAAATQIDRSRDEA